MIKILQISESISFLQVLQTSFTVDCISIRLLIGKRLWNELSENLSDESNFFCPKIFSWKCFDMLQNELLMCVMIPNRFEMVEDAVRGDDEFFSEIECRISSKWCFLI